MTLPSDTTGNRPRASQARAPRSPGVGSPLPEGLRPGGRFAEWARRPVRYAVADVDGTLIGDPPEVTSRVAAAARACVPASLPVGLASGRMTAAVSGFAESLGLAGPHIVHNGAQVIAQGHTIGHWPVPRRQAALLAELCAREGLYAEFYLDEGYVVTDRRHEARRHWELLGQDPVGLVADLDLERDEIIKATVLLFDHQPAAPVVGVLTGAGLTAGTARAPVMPAVTFVNVTDPHADKGRALAVAARHVGCALDEVLAVGDGDNDLPMLAVAGTAVAMGQAEPEVQAAAHLVVPEVAEDGLAHALSAALAWTR